MAYNLQRLVFCVSVFVVVLIGLGSSLRLLVEPQRFSHVKDNRLKISCGTEDSLLTKTIRHFEITKEGITKPIVTITNDEAWSMGPSFKDNMEANGNIDTDSGKPYVNLTINNSSPADAGVYTCRMFYHDSSYIWFEENAVSKVTAVDEDTSSILTYMLEKIGRLETELKQHIETNSEQSKALKQQIDDNLFQGKALKQQIDANTEQDKRLKQQVDANIEEDKALKQQIDANTEQDEELKQVVASTEQDNELKQVVANTEQDKRLKQQVVANREQDKRLKQQIDANTEQVKELKQRVVANTEQDKRLKQQINANTEQDKRLKQQVVANREQDKRLKQQIDANTEQDKELKQQVLANTERDKELKQQIDANTEQDEAMKQQVLSKIREMDVAKKTQQQNIQGLVDKDSFTCAFNVYRTKDKFLEGEKLTFQRDTLNIGDNYSMRSGVFTAPIKGLYVFHISAWAFEDEKCRIHLKVNGVTKGSLRAHDYDVYDQSSISSVLLLNSGDRVWPEVRFGCFLGDTDETFTVFNGYLLTLL